MYILLTNQFKYYLIRCNNVKKRIICYLLDLPLLPDERDEEERLEERLPE